MADLDELLICELNASQTWGLKQLDLGLDQQIKGDLRDEERGAGTGRVTDSSTNILNAQVLTRVHRVQSSAKNVVENVVDPGTSAQLLCRDLSRCSVNGSNKVAGEFGQQLQDQRALIHSKGENVRNQILPGTPFCINGNTFFCQTYSVSFAGEGWVTIGSQFLLGLSDQRVQLCLDVGKLVANVVHQNLEP